MPIPIKPINDKSSSYENNYINDYSFLANYSPISNENKDSKNSKLKVHASNSDADILMRLWLDSEKNNNKLSFSGKSDLSQREISKLKSYGFIEGSSNEFELTEKGKRVITVMALGETNNFEKNRKNKNYLEILASMDKKDKKGYRIPKFASNNSNNLRI